MKRRKSDWSFVGFAMVAVGIAVMIWRNVHEPDLMGLGRVLVILGALVAVFAKLNARSERSTEDFREGYDKGMDAGYEMAQKEKRERPVLVDFAAKRRERAAADPGAFIAATHKPEV